MQTEQLDLQEVVASYLPREAGKLEMVEIPPFMYLKVEGMGDPDASPEFSSALNWLYAVSYSVRSAWKARGQGFNIGSLEGLWRTGDLGEFGRNRRDRCEWTMMIMQPSFVSADEVASVIAAVAQKLGDPPRGLRLENYADGLCLQVLHVGAFSDEGSVISRMHRDYMPANGLQSAGDLHEIYLDDPRRVTPSKMRTVLRQPVRPATE